MYNGSVDRYLSTLCIILLPVFSQLNYIELNMLVLRVEDFNESYNVFANLNILRHQ